MQRVTGKRGGSFGWSKKLRLRRRGASDSSTGLAAATLSESSSWLPR